MDSLPKLALGTWRMGGDAESNPNNDNAKDIAIIQTALGSGITLIDTAQVYAAGACERIVGEAVANRPRQSFQILTKQARSDLDYQSVIDGCRTSLDRLGVDYIDYFVCHAPNQEFDMCDFFRATNKLYADGLIRHVGVSNFGPGPLKIALETSDIPISLNQVGFSLSNSDILTTGTYDFCQKNNIPIQAYQTLSGLKTDVEAMSMLGVLGSEYSLTPEQMVLAYLNSYDDIHFTIRSSSAQHWRQIKDALKTELSPDDISILKSLHMARHGEPGNWLTL